MKISSMGIEVPQSTYLRSYAAWAGAQRKTAWLLPLTLSSDVFELSCAHDTGLTLWSDMKLFVHFMKLLIIAPEKWKSRPTIHTRQYSRVASFGERQVLSTLKCKSRFVVVLSNPCTNSNSKSSGLSGRGNIYVIYVALKLEPRSSGFTYPTSSVIGCWRFFSVLVLIVYTVYHDGRFLM